MAAKDAGAWARLRLVQGNSQVSHQEFDSSTGESRLTIGSNPSCQWVVDDPTVEPFHLVLHWDGAVLSVAGSREAIPLTLDGEQVGTTFVSVGARSRLEFGRCALVAETSGAAGRRHRATLSSVPPPNASSSRPPARTITGVAALTDSSPPSRTPSSAPPGGPSPKFDPGRTAVGVPPMSGESPPSKASDWPAAPNPSPLRSSAGSDRPLGATLYGIGGDRPHHVDVVSPERLRRSSVPPGGAVDGGERATEPGYPPGRPQTHPGTAPGEASPGRTATAAQRRADPTPTDTRLVDDAARIRALGAVRAVPQVQVPSRPGEPTPTPSGARPALGSMESSFEAGGAGHFDGGEATGETALSSVQQSSVPAFRPSGPPRPRRPSRVAIAAGVAALLGLSAWVYALITL